MYSAPRWPTAVRGPGRANHREIRHAKRLSTNCHSLRSSGRSRPVCDLDASFATEAAPLAIKGYDPVAYFTIGSPTRGLPEIEYEWDEQSYRFASAED